VNRPSVISRCEQLLLLATPVCVCYQQKLSLQLLATERTGPYFKSNRILLLIDSLPPLINATRKRAEALAAETCRIFKIVAGYE